MVQDKLLWFRIGSGAQGVNVKTDKPPGFPSGQSGPLPKFDSHSEVFLSGQLPGTTNRRVETSGLVCAVLRAQHAANPRKIHRQTERPPASTEQGNLR